MIVYILLGVVYAIWIEWFIGTDKAIPKMRWLDRIFHVLLWPISAWYAVVEFVKYFRNNW